MEGQICSQLIRNQLIRFGESFSGPLTHLSSINGANQEELARLLQEITSSSAEEAKEWVKFKFPQLNKEIKQQPLQATPFEGFTKHCLLDRPLVYKEVMFYFI